MVTREYNLETHMNIIDYKKAFDHVNRNILLGITEGRGYPKYLIVIFFLLICLFFIIATLLQTWLCKNTEIVINMRMTEQIQYQ